MSIITPDQVMYEKHDKSFYEIPEVFTNPTVQQPVRIKDILYHLNIDFLKPILKKMYKENWRFHFEPLPVFKTLLYWRLKNHRFLTDVFNDLVTDPTLADILGFDYIP